MSKWKCEGCPGFFREGARIAGDKHGGYVCNLDADPDDSTPGYMFKDEECPYGRTKKD